MPRKKIEDDEIKDRILEILDHAGYSMSIKKITEELLKRYGIRRSPQVIKRHLLHLKRDGRIE